MITLSVVLYSHFTAAVRDYPLWSNSNAPFIDDTFQSQQDSYQDERHISIVLQYDSNLPQNISGPMKVIKGAQAIFDFTVEQRRFAGEAKTVGSLEELKATVSECSFKLVLISIGQ